MRTDGIAAGLMLAGVLVTLIGLAVVAVRIFELPRYWTPVAVGTALLIAGAALRSIQGRGPWRRT
jgi:xanthine/uracil permease